MKIDDLFEKMKSGTPVQFKGVCCDCNSEVEIQAHILGDSIVIDGGAVFAPPAAWNHQDMYMFKCQKCFEKDSKFYPKTEVYSRVVGYMRPVSQWNDGKKAEFDTRKTFEFDSCCQ